MLRVIWVVGVGWVEGNDIFVLFDLFVLGQFQYLYFVQFWNSCKVEVVEVFDGWVFCSFDVMVFYDFFVEYWEYLCILNLIESVFVIV